MRSTYANPTHFTFPISMSDFEIMKKLGEGKHGCVRKAMYKKTGKIYAIKNMHQSYFLNSQVKEIDFLREITILYDLTQRNYPHIIKLFANFEDMQNRYLVLELVDGTSLEELRGTGFQPYIDEKLVIHILTQLLETLEFLHDKCKVIHRDIKPDNIYLGKDNNIKLLDFGLAAYIENPNDILVSKKSLKGALRYVPPEILLFKPRIYDYKIDIFSLGYTMYSVMNPSEDVKKNNLPTKTEMKDENVLRFDLHIENNFYSPWLIEFVRSLYEADQNKRPSAADALGLLKGFQNNPKVTEIYNNLKCKRQASNPNIDHIIRPQNNINNEIFTRIEQENPMAKSSKQLNQQQMSGIGITNMNFVRTNTNVGQEAEEFLQPSHGKDNKILSSMKSLILILYKLDIFNLIRAQLQSLFSNCQLPYQESGLFALYNIFESIQQFEMGNINQQFYTEKISDFIRKVFISSHCGVSGNRPIILYYMISCIVKDDFKQYFDFYKNNLFNDVISSNYMSFNSVIPMNNQKIYNSICGYIIDFINKYKGLFVDNFYFLTLSASRCPNCGNLFGIRNNICTFLQLNVPNPQNNIMDIIKDYFSPQPGTGNYNCTNCGLKGKKVKTMYCCNFPNYLFLEFEDKNKIIFTENITIPLYNGQISYYQYCAGIYKYKMNDVSCFVAIIKYGNAFYFCCDDTIKQCDPSYVNMECPSLAIYKRVLN